MIQVQQAVKRFGSITALKDISCRIEEGSVYGMVGSNGAGKSTFLRLVSGVYKPDGGLVAIDGASVFDNPAVKARLVFVPDELYFLPGSTLTRMAVFYRSFFPHFDEERFHFLTKAFNLDEKRLIHGFSKGMRRQSATLLALSCRPDYYFFDETFDGLDPVMRRLVKGLINEDVADKNATAIITSHSLRELEDTCDQLALLHKGGLILQSNIQDLKTSLFKVQIAFDRPFNEGLFSSLQVENCRINGGVAQLILRGDKYEILSRLKQLDPVLLDVLPLNLEEIFTYEMKELGYSFEDVLEKEAKNEEKSV